MQMCVQMAECELRSVLWRTKWTNECQQMDYELLYL